MMLSVPSVSFASKAAKSGSELASAMKVPLWNPRGKLRPSNNLTFVAWLKSPISTQNLAAFEKVEPPDVGYWKFASSTADAHDIQLESITSDVILRMYCLM